MKRILSLLLVLTLCLGMLPANVWAEAVEEATEYVETTEETEETEETTLPAEPEETEPAEEETVEEEPEVVETEAADGPEPVETVTLEPVTEVWINPEYRDLFSEADIGISDISGFEGEGTPCSSPEEVIEALREGLVNRQKNPTATLVTTRAYHEETKLQTDILNSLFDHTGEPKEGDYLRRDIGYSEITMGISCTTQDGVTTWTYTFILTDIQYFTTAAQEREMDQEVSRVLSSLALDGKSQKEKIDAIYNYLIRNVKYVSDAELADESNVIKYSSYAALVQHNAVCQGFAGAFYRLCLESGIDSRIVSSDAMNHAWNIVELDGSYYHLDATWDINWPNAPRYYLRGTTYWKAEHRSSTTGDISELGDQFADGSFAAAYPVPEGDYKKAETPEVASGKCGDDLTWKLDGNGLLTISGTGAMYDYAALPEPQEQDAPWAEMDVRKLELEQGITHIGNYAFYHSNLSGEIEIPNGVNSIGHWAFATQSEITECVLPDTLESIGYYAFLSTGIPAAYIPASVEEIGNGAFTGHTRSLIEVDPQNENFVVKNGGLYTKDMTRLLAIYMTTMGGFDIPDSVTTVDDWVFLDVAKLTSLHLGAGVSSFGYVGNPLMGCPNLEQVTVSDANTAYYAVDNVLFASNSKELVSYPTTKTDRIYTVPAGVKSLGQWSIGANQNLQELIIPEGVTKIGDQAAMCCKNLKTVTVPQSVTEVGDAPLGYWNYGEPIEGFTIKGYRGSVAESYAEEHGFTFVSLDIEQEAGGSCGDHLTWKLADGTLTISGTGAMYDYEAFFGDDSHTTAPWYGLPFEKLVLEDDITYIGRSAFQFGGPKGQLVLPNSLEGIGPCAFFGCDELTGKLVLPEGLRYIGGGAFNVCSGLTGTLALPESLEEVDATAFNGCTGLTGTLKIPAHLTKIGGGAFGYTQISAIRVDKENPAYFVKNSALYTVDGKTLVACPNTKVGRLEIAEGTDIIGFLSLCGCEKLTSVSIPVSMSTIEDADFSSCAKLKDIYYAGTWRQWQAIEGGKWLEGKKLHLTYEITYTGIPENVKNPNSLTCTTDERLTLEPLTCPGYSFLGWFDAAEGGQKMTEIPKGISEDVTLYARWTPNTYTVRFNANKGTGKMPDQKGILYGEATELSPCAFTRKGYRFTGWNTKANGTGETVDEALNLTAANRGTVTLYAQWEGEPYNVTFHFGEETRTQTLRYGTAEALDGNPFVNPGYTFKCWTSQENGKGKNYKDGAKVTNLTDRDLYAQWTANKYTVVFHSNLAKDTSRKQTLTYDGKETALTANSFSWKGHAFRGWAEARDAAEPDYTNKEKVRNLTTEKTIDLYAVWKVNEYTVAFDPNGAEGEEITQDMTYDVPAELEANRFERQGYTFQGWSTTAKGKAVHRDGKEVKNLTDKDGVTLRLYAVWAPTSYMVSFEPGEGATGTMKSVKMTYGKTYTLTGVSFKRANYTFAGWRDAETGETYANKAKVSDLSADGGTVTLVAQWKPTEYAITYKNISTWEKEDLLTSYKSYNVLTDGLPGTPSRPGCEFGGWFLDSGCKKPFNGFENIAKPGKLTLYPKWVGTPSKYTLHFAPGAEDVTGKMADKKNLVCGKDYTLANNAFKRPGWQFAGWEIGGVTLGNKAKFSNLPAYLKDFVSGGTVTLTAKWVQPGDGGDIPLK